MACILKFHVRQRVKLEFDDSLRLLGFALLIFAGDLESLLDEVEDELLALPSSQSLRLDIYCSVDDLRLRRS
jgi:hypothetical protein